MGRNKPLPLPGKKTRTALAVDTSFSQHRGQAPQQIYPRPVPTCDTENPRSFISLSDIEEGKRVADSKLKGFRQRLESAVRVRDGPQKALSGRALRRGQALESVHAYVDEVSPPLAYHNTASVAQEQRLSMLKPLDTFRAMQHKAARRPPPLKLNPGISPSDRAIPIGIAVSSASMPDHQNTLELATASSYSLHSTLQRGQTQELKTPTIIVTPAQEDYSDFDTLPTDLRQPTDHRPRSSVYSRYTNGAPNRRQNDNAPPVPPLPRFAIEKMPEAYASQTRFPTQGNAIEDSPPYPKSSQSDKTLSAITLIEDDHTQLPSAYPQSLRASSQAILPTPRHSRGWWNIITSPFSSSPAARSLFIRSPPIVEEFEHDDQPILAGVSNMGQSYGPCFTDRAMDDDELRSAPPADSNRPNLSLRPLGLPKRSDTAPGALDRGNEGAVNIYRIPSCGEASAYYDRGRRYPSLIATAVRREGSNEVLGLGLQQGWSPLQNDVQEVVPTENLKSSRGERGIGGGQRDPKAPKVVMFESPSQEELGAAQAGPVEEPMHLESSRAISAPNTYKSIVTRDIQDDAQGDGLADDALDSQVHAPANHDWTPLSPSPILEDAHTARFTRPTPSYVDTAQPEGGKAQSEYGSESTTPPAEGNLPVESSEKSASGLLPNYNEKQGQVQASGESIQAPARQRPSRRAFLWLLGAVLVFSAAMAGLMILLLLPFHPSDMPVEAEWLNLTGFPPMPTGVLTVVGADKVSDVSGCIAPSSLWSCDVPIGQGLSTTPASQPNFRFLIRFRNETLANETLLTPANTTFVRRDTGLAANARAVVKQRSLWSHSVFTPSPAPPSTEDQIFLGRTTDHDSVPYNGIQTPFYISLLDPIALPLEKRSTIQKRGFHYPYPPPSDYNSSRTTTGSDSTPSSSPATKIPGPTVTNNDDPAPPKLYPFASAQPLRLFNIGQASEHYAFYTYFDRSLYIHSSADRNSSSSSPAPKNSTTLPRAATGNTALNHSSAVCTWSDTRFLVQIWTRKGDVTSLLPSAANAASAAVAAANSTANDMRAPGSFPYPVTITLDRHGGSAGQKGVYCYQLDAEQHVVDGSGTWVPENRAFGGSIVNPAPVPTNNGTVLSRRGEGGIDGGTGGCTCQWQNFA